jgi:hypothetical protein
MRIVFSLKVATGLAALICTIGASAQPTPTPSSERPMFLDQGWNEDDRTWFYTTSQGSQMMPYSWFMAIERPDSEALFVYDKLARFGYLPPYPSRMLDERNPDGLPIGFVLDPGSGKCARANCVVRRKVQAFFREVADLEAAAYR